MGRVWATASIVYLKTNRIHFYEGYNRSPRTCASTLITSKNNTVFLQDLTWPQLIEQTKPHFLRMIQTLPSPDPHPRKKRNSHHNRQQPGLQNEVALTLALPRASRAATSEIKMGSGFPGATLTPGNRWSKSSEASALNMVLRPKPLVQRSKAQYLSVLGDVGTYRLFYEHSDIPTVPPLMSSIAPFVISVQNVSLTGCHVGQNWTLFHYRGTSLV